MRFYSAAGKRESDCNLDQRCLPTTKKIKYNGRLRQEPARKCVCEPVTRPEEN